jgi:L-amino acid N-acyltransferase YncA
MQIRPYDSADETAVWGILEPVLRAGDTYALPPDWSRRQAMDFWCMDGHQVFVAEDAGIVLGTYYLQANQKGGGAHVANCGFVTRVAATGRGIARNMCGHALDLATRQGFRAMQFNFVVSTNTRAVALWRSFGFDVVGTLPGAFRHPAQGYVDALVMFKRLAA